MTGKTLLETVVDRIRPRRIRPATPPVTFTDSSNRQITLRPYRESDYGSLVEMYDGLDSESRAQGTPPMDPTAISEWVSTNLVGPDVVALHGTQLIGHVSFVPDGTGRHELAIFVHQDFQQRGIGSELLAVGMGHARDQGVEYVWASVEKSSRHVHRFYTRAGFSVNNPMGITYRMSRYL